MAAAHTSLPPFVSQTWPVVERGHMTVGETAYLVLNECKTGAESIQAFCMRYFSDFHIPASCCTSGVVEEGEQKHHVTIISGRGDESRFVAIARAALSCTGESKDAYFTCEIHYNSDCQTITYTRDAVPLSRCDLQYVFLSKVEPFLLPHEPETLLLRSIVAMPGRVRLDYLENLAAKASELGLKRLKTADLAGCFSEVMTQSGRLSTLLKAQKGVVHAVGGKRTLGVFGHELADIFLDDPLDEPIGHGTDSTVHVVFSPLHPYERLVAAETQFRGPFVQAVQRALNDCPYVVPVYRTYGPYVRRIVTPEGDLKRAAYTRSVMPFYPAGSLESFCLHREEAKPLPLAEAFYLLKQILLGAMFMHARGYAHTDLCPENIVLKAQREEGLLIGIIDFGGATMAKHPLERRHMHRHYTPPQQAREYLHPHIDSIQSMAGAVDVWQLGILATRLLFGYEPYQDKEKPYEDLASLQEKDGSWIRDVIKDVFAKNTSYYEGTVQVSVSDQLFDWLQLLLQPDILRRCSLDVAFQELNKLEQRLFTDGLIAKPQKLPYSLEYLQKMLNKTVTSSSVAEVTLPPDAPMPTLPGAFPEEVGIYPTAIAAWTTSGARSPLTGAAAILARAAHGGAGRSSSGPVFARVGSDGDRVISVGREEAVASARTAVVAMSDLAGDGGAGSAMPHVGASSAIPSAFIGSTTYRQVNKAVVLPAAPSIDRAVVTAATGIDRAVVTAATGAVRRREVPVATATTAWCC